MRCATSWTAPWRDDEEGAPAVFPQADGPLAFPAGAEKKPTRAERKELKKEQKAAVAKLAPKYQEWMSEVELLMTAE